MSEDYYQEVADKFIFTVKKSLLYAENDVWIEIRNGKAKIGVTDFLQRRGGDVVFVKILKEGSIIKRLDEIANYETIKAVLPVTSPFNGVIAEINTSVNDKPELINEDPYGEGWLVLISPSNLEEDRKHLITAEKYFELMKSKIKDELGKSKKEA